MLFNGSQKYNIYYDIPNKLLKFTINSDKKIGSHKGYRLSYYKKLFILILQYSRKPLLLHYLLSTT